MYAMFAFILAMLIYSYGAAWIQLRGIKAQITVPQNLQAGKPYELVCILKSKSARYLLSFELPSNGQPFEQLEAVQLDELTKSGQAKIPVMFSMRGEFKIDQIKIYSCFPFGIVKKNKLISIEPVEIFVAPKIHELKGLPTEHMLSSNNEGNLAQHQMVAAEDFASVRSYRDGDEMRNIHWRMSAKHNEWIVKEFDATRAPSIMIILNTTSDLCASKKSNASVFDAKEHMIEIAASTAAKCVQMGMGCRVIVGEEMIDVRPSQRDLIKLLTALAKLDLPSYSGEYKNQVKQAYSSNPTFPVAITFTAKLSAHNHLNLPLFPHQYMIEIGLETQTYLETSVDIRPIQRTQSFQTTKIDIHGGSNIGEIF